MAFLDLDVAISQDLVDAGLVNVSPTTAGYIRSTGGGHLPIHWPISLVPLFTFTSFSLEYHGECFALFDPSYLILPILLLDRV
jgi:hypothetical protein